jgi:hypothetical protein
VIFSFIFHKILCYKIHFFVMKVVVKSIRKEIHFQQTESQLSLARTKTIIFIPAPVFNAYSVKSLPRSQG